MSDYGVFDILGPIMIGPSSSHTAGAARLGKIAKEIVDKMKKRVIHVSKGEIVRDDKKGGYDCEV